MLSSEAALHLQMASSLA